MLDEDGDGEEAQQIEQKESEPEAAEERELDLEDDEIKKRGERMQVWSSVKSFALVFYLWALDLVKCFSTNVFKSQPWKCYCMCRVCVQCSFRIVLLAVYDTVWSSQSLRMI